MKRSLFIEPEAEADITNARLWYEQQRSGLGDEFLLSLEASFEAITMRPNSFPSVRKGVRRALTPRFPYLVLFVESRREASIFVVGVFHTSRNPRTWTKRAR
ncbi:MAG TPA: type II toxin-antitoxin system RelE/ParE family toxin [Tepidisphaeraceae bacterium]|jgi:plasmid stabilization system protein ParE